MPKSSRSSTTADRPVEPRPRRSYDSPVRRLRAAETRSRILTAGAALARELGSWDWRELTFRAVAERAGVGERTVFRYFNRERDLHRAVMRQLEIEAGVEYEGLTLGALGEMARRVFVAMNRFAVPDLTSSARDVGAAVAEEDDRRRTALLAAVSQSSTAWPDPDIRQAAGVLDVLWQVAAYERLVVNWELDGDEAISAIEWALALVAEAIQRGQRPTSERTEALRTSSKKASDRS